MKILTRGTPPKDRIWLGTCATCKSTAEATESEMKNIRHDTRDGTSFSWEQCPVCHIGNSTSGYGGMLFCPKKYGVSIR